MQGGEVRFMVPGQPPRVMPVENGTGPQWRHRATIAGTAVIRENPARTTGR